MIKRGYFNAAVVLLIVVFFTAVRGVQENEGVAKAVSAVAVGLWALSCAWLGWVHFPRRSTLGDELTEVVLAKPVTCGHCGNLSYGQRCSRRLPPTDGLPSCVVIPRCRACGEERWSLARFPTSPEIAFDIMRLCVSYTPPCCPCCRGSYLPCEGAALANCCKTRGAASATTEGDSPCAP